MICILFLDFVRFAIVSLGRVEILNVSNYLQPPIVVQGSNLGYNNQSGAKPERLVSSYSFTKPFTAIKLAKTCNTPSSIRCPRSLQHSNVQLRQK